MLSACAERSRQTGRCELVSADVMRSIKLGFPCFPLVSDKGMIEKPMNPTPIDPVVDEIREVRHRISEQCNHDPATLVAYYMELQKQHSDRLIDSTQRVERRDSSAI